MSYRYFEVVLLAETLHDEEDVSVWYVRSLHYPSPADVLKTLHADCPDETCHLVRVDSIDEVYEEDALMYTRCSPENFVTIKEEIQ